MVTKEKLAIYCLLLIFPGVKGDSGLPAVIIAAVVSVLLLAILVILIGMLYYWRHAISGIDRRRTNKELADRKRRQALSQQSIIANEKRQGIMTNSRPPSEHSTRFNVQKEPSERSLQMHPTPNFSDKANTWIQESPTSGYDIKERVINFDDDEEDVIITEVLDDNTTSHLTSQNVVTGRNTLVDNNVEPLSRLSQRQSNLAASGVEMTNYEGDVAVANLRGSRMDDDSMVLY